ncbi:MAG: TIGR02466 family protein, partial [Alphaproteobacteria bacterium]
GDAERALKLLRKAVAAQPDHVDAHNNLGNVLKASARLDEAEAAYRRALEIMPDYVGGHFNLGIVLAALERPDEAATAYRQALELKPDFAEAALALGNAVQAMGRIPEAIETYARALEMAPDHADGHNNHGSALREVGELDAAVAAYRRALEIEPRHLDARYNLGIALQEQHKLDEAIAAYRQAIELDPDFAPAWVNLGYALQGSGRLDKAIESYRRAIEIVPDYAGAHVNLADALLESGDTRAAAEVCEGFLAGHPGDSALLAFKAVVLDELGERGAARALVDFERFIRPVRLEAPARYSGLDEFNAALAEHVSGHPTLVQAPARHATRFGKHSGELLAEPKGPVADLEAKIRAAVEAYLGSLGADPGHPFVASAPRRFTLSVWSIILEGQGHQVPHIHPTAWLSGVYYVRLPELMSRPGSGEAGWIEFGRPPDHFHNSAAPEVRAYQPEQGLMFLFPSYFYHRTVPFDSADQRISISFDVLPTGDVLAKGRA